MSQHFLWYDLETFGRDPRRSRIAQFAAIRTDADLQPIEAPLSLFCRPADDLLPSPAACLITGISPQKAQAEGLCEAELAAHIHEAMSRPGTCVAGYNSIRFDDEFIRNLFYRDFFDPYEREWRNGNSRWDLIDAMRMAYALRPEGINWPLRADGAPSFRLEDLAAANAIGHTRAHDALSDVEATLALARRLRQAQPRLFDYAFALRDKRRAASLLDYPGMTPVLHISQRYPAIHGCARLVLPLAPHPQIASQIIVCDLGPDPGPWLDLPVDTLVEQLYTARTGSPEQGLRPPLKLVHLNRAPILVELRHLRPPQLQRLGIDLDTQLAHARRLRETSGLAAKVQAVFAREPHTGALPDPDLAIYTGFASPHDRSLLPRVRQQQGRAPAADGFGFDDPRYEELAFRYRARNFPALLDPGEQARWQDFRAQRLAPGSPLSEYDFPAYFAEIERLRADPGHGPEARALLDALHDWGHKLQASLPVRHQEPPAR